MDQTITSEEYQKLKTIDIRGVDPKLVTDIRTVKIDPTLPAAERIRDVVRQMGGNPFIYRCGGILVKTSFVGTKPLQEILEECLEYSK